MFDWFSKKPLFDDATTDWMFEVFRWALENLEREVFYAHTQLVLPDDGFFPGRAGNPQEMAELVFGRVREYAGMSHWPCQVFNASAVRPMPVQREMSGPLRLPGQHPPAQGAAPLPILYDPTLVNNPEALIGAFAQTLAWHLTGQLTIPGGEENRPHAAELVAVFLGFGLMMANSAYLAPKRSCGSCGGPSATRQSFLSQYHMTYALAIFCVLKEIPARQPLPFLKSPLRGHFKRAMKEVARDEGRLGSLRGGAVRPQPA